MKTPNLLRSRRSRAHKRGAAMIEGIIVISTMLVFMGLIMYTRQGYGMKLDLQQTTRANTLYYASHGCEGSANGASTSTAATPGGSPEADTAAAKNPSGGTASRTFNTASASANGSVAFKYVFDANANGGNNTINYQTKQGSRSVSAGSKVTCNEKKYDSQWTAWMKFGIDFFTHGFGGVGDLFK